MLKALAGRFSVMAMMVMRMCMYMCMFSAVLRRVSSPSVVSYGVRVG